MILSLSTGFQNYIDIFNPTNPDKSFPVTLLDGVQDLILQIPAIVIFALFMAIILNQKMAGRTVFRAIFFLPVILSTGIIDTIDTNSAFMQAVSNSVKILAFHRFTCVCIVT